jgi:hypothetical protein
LVDGIIDGNISAIATNTISSNPLFVDTITFKLQSGSAAINAALISAAPVIDYYGLTRDQNPDIGAAEYFAALSTNDVVVKDNIALYPNPTNGQIFIQGTTPKQIRIFNILGEEVTNTIDIRWTIGTTIVNLKALGVGVYIIKTDDQILKVIKK